MSEAIYNAAKKYLGTRELAGPKSNPILAEMFKLAPSWLDQDDSETAWCGIFRGYIGHITGTGLPAAHYRAKEWLNWGKKVALADAKRGDTVVFSRPGGYHVALYDRQENGHVYTLGGNQGDAVNISRYPMGSVQGVRRAV